MSKKFFNLLLVEDDPAHADLICRHFKSSDKPPQITIAGSVSQARKHLAQSHPDLVISDLVLPDGKGIDLIARKGKEITLPLIIMTSFGDEQVAVESIKAGALDYVVKSSVTFKDMPRIAERAIQQWNNITKRRMAEEKLRAYQRRLRSLALELSLTEERERRLIATDLHDNIGQLLAMTKIKLGQVRAMTLPDEIEENLDTVVEFIEKAIHYTRSLTSTLCPPVLYEVGFEAGIEWLIEYIRQNHNLETRLIGDGCTYPLGDDMRGLLFQVVRELLINVVKHAQAKNVIVEIHQVNQHIKISVQDDGVGFNASLIGSRGYQGGGFGLFSIRERLDSISGHLKIHSRLGQGTTATLSVPLQMAVTCK